MDSAGTRIPVLACFEPSLNFAVACLLCEIDSLFRPQRRWLIRTVMDPLNFKFVNNLRPPCSKCSRPLILTRIEPEGPGFDLRVYYCAHCEANEIIIAAV
jgi:hypothetical protein